MNTLPILIIGAGPVGLSLAVALNQKKIQAHVYEALPELSTEARASTFHPPTLEMFAEWGVLDPLLAKGYKVDRLQYWERATRELVAEFKYSYIAGDTAYPFRLQCPQSTATRVLKPIVEKSEYGAVNMDHKLIAFKDQGDHVEATFETTQGNKTVKGAYLCAADGSKSTVRAQLNLKFEGKTYEDRFLLIPTDIDFKPLFLGFGPVNYIFDPTEWVIVLHLPDVVRVVFRVRDDEKVEEVLSDDSINKRLRSLVGDGIPFTIKGRSIYSVHQRVAETFRVGRILLAGDAAHINNPAGGMGMNSGIHDAYMLAQALASNDEKKLNEYSEVRRAAAVHNVQAHTDKGYMDLSAADEAYRADRNETLRTIAANPKRAREYLLRAAMLEDRIK